LRFGAGFAAVFYRTEEVDIPNGDMRKHPMSPKNKSEEYSEKEAYVGGVFGKYGAEGWTTTR